jgi:hypothetical protein
MGLAGGAGDLEVVHGNDQRAIHRLVLTNHVGHRVGRLLAIKAKGALSVRNQLRDRGSTDAYTFPTFHEGGQATLRGFAT